MLEDIKSDLNIKTQSHLIPLQSDKHLPTSSKLENENDVKPYEKTPKPMKSKR